MLLPRATANALLDRARCVEARDNQGNEGMLLVTHVLKPKFIFAARAIIILANLAVAAVVKIQKVYPGNFNDFNWTLLGVKMCKVPCRKKSRPNPKKSIIRHLLKAFTWRFIASGTTFLLAWFFFQDDAQAVQKATSIAIAESVLKMGLYYFHERAWYRYGKLGRDEK